MTEWLPLIWAALLALAVIIYVVLDGFDLGIGILFPTAKSREERDHMIATIAPFWDGNETWLVLGGGGLFAAFPLAYAILMPALYVPVTLMLLALIFRGVAFEFRFRSERLKLFWDRAFIGGSAAATFFQGAILGAFLQGFDVDGRDFAGGPFDWLTLFSLFTGLALIAGYAMLGCGWLILKLEGPIQDRAFKTMPWLLGAVLAAIALVSLWTPLRYDAIFERWFTLPNLIYLSPEPLLTAACAFGVWRAARKKHELQPFLFAIALFMLAYGGLAISLWPYMVPPEIPYWEAASAPQSLGFMLIGAGVLLPVILGYTAYVYWVFRGKTAVEDGYH